MGMCDEVDIREGKWVFIHCFHCVRFDVGKVHVCTYIGLGWNIRKARENEIGRGKKGRPSILLACMHANERGCGMYLRLGGR
jgi:hypothetical protein